MLYLSVAVAAPLFVFAPKLWQGFVLAPEDGFVQNFPGFAAKSSLLWTPLILTGFPVAADPQLAMFYPLHSLAGFFPPFLGWNLYVLSAFVLATFFMALYCRRLTGSTFAGLVGGILYGLGGYQISELRHVQVLHAALWLPLALLLVDRIQIASILSKKVICALSLVFSMTVLAGHMQTAVYVIGCTLAYGALRRRQNVLGTYQAPRLQLIPLFGALPALVWAGLICAVQILPTQELVSLSVRTTFNAKDFLSGQVEPFQMLGFIIPYVMGPRYGSLDGMPFSEQGPPPGLLFYGLGAIVLSALSWRERKTQPVLFFSGLFLFSLAFALGERGLAPLLAWLPPLNYFRELYRILLLAGFAICVLASIGAASLEKRACRGRSILSYLREGRLKYHFCLAFYLFLSFLIPPLLPGTLPLFIYHRHKNKFTAALLVVSLYAVSVNYAWLSQWYKNCPTAVEFTAPVAAPALISKLGWQWRIFTLKGLEASVGAFPPNLSRLWQVASANGYEPLMPVRYGRLLGMAEGGFLEPPWRISSENRAFDICSVRYFLAPSGEFGAAAFHDGAEKFWPLLKEEGGVLTYENLRSLPRFRVVQEIVKLSGEQTLYAVRHSRLPDGTEFKPEQTALVEDIQSMHWPRSEARLEVTYSSDEEILLKVESKGPAFLVAADQYYPGWSVYVDGVPQPLLRTNYVQRGLLLDGGVHKVLFRYAPESFKNGLILSCSGLLACLAILLVEAAQYFARRCRR